MSRDDSGAIEQEGLVDKLVILKDNILQNKPARYSLALLFISFAILLFIPILVNNEALKGSSAQKLKEVLGHDVVIKGDVNIEILPIPKIIARDVLILNYKPNDSKYNYNAFIKSAEIKLRVFKSDESSIIKGIKFSGVVAEKRYISSNSQDSEGMDIQNIKVHLQNKYGVASSKVDKSISGLSFDSLSLTKVTKSDFSLTKFPEIEINNAKVITYDIYGNKKEYNSLYCNIDVSNNKISSDGYFAVSDILTSFDSKLVFDKEIKDNNNSYLQIESPSLNFRFEGNLASAKGLDEDFEIKGSVISEIKDLRDFYLSYVGAKSAFSSKLKNHTPIIKINAQISSDKDGSFVDNLKIRSPIINGTGSISIYKSSVIPIIDVMLDIKDVDIDSMWSTTSDKTKENTSEVESTSIFGIDKIETFLAAGQQTIVKKDFDLTFEIKSNLAIYKNTPLSDLNIYLSSQRHGQLIVNPISFRFPGNGIFHANGELNSSGGAPKFVGKVNLSGDNPKTILRNSSMQGRSLKLDFISKFNLYSDLNLEANRMDLGNLFVNINNKETEISGDLSYSIVDKKPFFKGDFRVNNLDVQNQMRNLNIARYTNGGSLIEKVFWLNDLSFETAVKLRFDRIGHAEEEFYNSSLDLEVKRGKIELSNIIIDPKSHNSRASFLIDISKSTPELVINVEVKSLTMFSKERKSSKPQYISATKGITSFADAEYDSHLLFRTDTFKQFFNMVSLNGFSGEMKFNIQNLLFKNKLLENFRFNAKLNNGILDNVSLATAVGNTQFQYKGSIGLKKVKTLSGTAQLTNFNVQPVISDLFNISNIDTTLNASAAVSAYGDDTASFANSLDGELKFNAVAPVVKGYGLRNLIRKMFYPKKNYEQLKEPDKIISNVDTKTIFKNATGSVIFKQGSAKVISKVTGVLSNSVLSGNIGLLDKEVNLAFNTIFLTGSKNKLAPISIATNIKGNVGNLSCASNYDQIMEYLGIKKIDKVLEKNPKDETTEEEGDKRSPYYKKTLEIMEKESSNKAESTLRKHRIYVPKDNNTSADYLKQIQPAN